MFWLSSFPFLLFHTQALEDYANPLATLGLGPLIPIIVMI